MKRRQEGGEKQEDKGVSTVAKVCRKGSNAMHELLMTDFQRLQEVTHSPVRKTVQLT